jgi:hypothetical protein
VCRLCGLLLEFSKRSVNKMNGDCTFADRRSDSLYVPRPNIAHVAWVVAAQWLAKYRVLPQMRQVEVDGLALACSRLWKLLSVRALKDMTVSSSGLRLRRDVTSAQCPQPWNKLDDRVSSLQQDIAPQFLVSTSAAYRCHCRCAK